ncbi:MAG: hypothetical protein RMJ67_09070, partial [Elusimicrobiota bacterium]|nr:hypothetical protein [Endomicrobiia bacterium]MDW8166648.1 hypothetical protein [Elusimicrobiota bacterium]
MTEQTKYEKVEHYIWEDKVRQWKECLMCGAEWTPISLVKGLCPECRGILETEIYSIAIKKLKNIYEKNGYIFDEEAKAIIS